MGWFLPFSLTGSSTSKKGRGKGKGKGRGKNKKNQRQWDPQRTLLGLKVVGIAVLIVGMGVAWTTGQSALVGYAQENRSRPVTPADVHLLDAPPWIATPLLSYPRYSNRRSPSIRNVHASSLPTYPTIPHMTLIYLQCNWFSRCGSL